MDGERERYGQIGACIEEICHCGKHRGIWSGYHSRMAIGGRVCLHCLANVTMASKENYNHDTRYGWPAAIAPSLYLPVVPG
jgi:hypothetical protein